jgi:hypothetical protein
MSFFLFLLAGPQQSAATPQLGRASPTARVIVLEDLRWADRDTVELVEYLAGNVSGLLVLLVLTLRDTPASTASAARRLRKLARNHLSPPRAIDRRPPNDPGARLPGPSGFRTA